MYNLLRHSKHSLFPTEFHRDLCLKLIESSPGKLIPLNDLISISRSLTRDDNRKKAGFFPCGMGKLILQFLFLNQQVRWGFKRLLFFRKMNTRERNRKSLITNDFDLLGDPLPNTIPSRRVLLLWDNASSRYYVFPWHDIYSIFKNSILCDEPSHPKNPYTNLRFSRAQLVEIRDFFLKNADRIRSNEISLLAYLRWNKISIAHAFNQIYFFEINVSSGEMDHQYDNECNTILLDSIISVFQPQTHKQHIVNETRKAYMKYCQSASYKDSIFIPSTKQEFFMFNHGNSLDSGNYTFLDTWSRHNEKHLVYGNNFNRIANMESFYSSLAYIPRKEPIPFLPISLPPAHSTLPIDLPNPFTTGEQQPSSKKQKISQVRPRQKTQTNWKPNPFADIEAISPPIIDVISNRTLSIKKRNRV